MKTMHNTQCTVRGIPERLDLVMRSKARQSGRSLNQTALDALARGLGLDQQEPVRYHDLDALAGSWVEDPAFDAAVAVMDRVDEDLWK